MIQRLRLPMLVIAVSLGFLMGNMPVRAQSDVKGLRIFSTGHSFHYFVPPILADMAKKAGIKDHQQLGLSSIGGSRVYQHWNVPEEKNKAREMLKAGKVDVFTMAPI